MAENREVPFELSDYVLRKDFTLTASRQGWLRDSQVIVAVSGGGDSIAMLWMCREFFTGRVIAVHVNHGIRGLESDGDEEFTRTFAEGLGLEFVSVRVSVPNERLRGESLESAARRLRLESLCTAAKSLNTNTVLLAHNRDDLAETVLFNLLRGTGVRGAVGITECSELDGVRFCRPLLGFRRDTLRDILRVRGITWREDSSNNDEAYTRNYIRLKLLPLIQERINSEAVEHLAQFGQDMRTVRQREDELSIRLFTSCLESDSPLTLNARHLRHMTLDDISLVIRESGRRLGLRTLSRRRCSEFAGLIQGGRSFTFQWQGNIQATCTKGRLTIYERTRY